MSATIPDPRDRECAGCTANAFAGWDEGWLCLVGMPDRGVVDFSLCRYCYEAAHERREVSP